MGQAVNDVEGLAGRNELFAGERAADEVDEGIGEMGDVAEGFMADLGADPEGATEEVGAIELIFVAAFGSGHMDAARSGWHSQL